MGLGLAHEVVVAVLADELGDRFTQSGALGGVGDYDRVDHGLLSPGECSQRPVNLGRRFAMKAVTPSTKSSVAAASVMQRCSAARCSRNPLLNVWPNRRRAAQ